ncbi:MAG: ribonuclease III domain-containing protein [Bacillota bacterium]|nr:ribonuclease III domain-containing protein [Bacillota bacterium]
MDNFFESLNLKSISESELRRMSPIQLAYLGDVIYEFYIRNYALVVNKNRIKEVNKFVVNFVRASAQAHAVMNLKEFLSEDEWGIVKWGRNQKTASSPKNASISQYKYATGFETLIGYLYLKNEKDRLEVIISEAIVLINNMEAQ